jgi:hypothetical protein
MFPAVHYKWEGELEYEEAIGKFKGEKAIGLVTEGVTRCNP